MFYLELFRQLEAHKVRYALVGGLAMNLHGVPRMTMDIDIVLALDDENLHAFMTAANALGLKPVAPVALEDLTHPSRRRAWITEKGMVAFGLRAPEPSTPTVDVLLDPPLDIQRALKRVIHRDLGDLRVPLASLEDMILLKEKAGRAQDKSDIEHLRRLLPESKK